MRIDSCRKCGNKMEPSKDNCGICGSPVKFVCSECRKEAEIQYHVQFHKNSTAQGPAPILKVK
ncbi:MAG TPA: hypothetical protein VFG25_04200 [Nitrosopumilaceae archaeon]|nr:hypothetical protein [Nitrosopumilaceae archaeon]